MSDRFSKDDWVVPFEQLRMSDVEVVGGKNASLGEMISQLPQGVRVPTGFATTAHAFRAFLRNDGLDERINAILNGLDTDDVRALAQAGAKIRDMVQAQPLPPALEAAIRACRNCVLCKGRKQAVPGSGDRQASWMMVGEAPGAEEDATGLPFVGKAGKLLDAMLAALNLKRDQGVYIANAVKCRPPENRTPDSGEIDACNVFLTQQIELVQPEVIVALGKPAALAVLGHADSIQSLRGAVQYREQGGRRIPVIVTYHPAYLLRQPEEKWKSWQDLLLAASALGGR